MKKIILTIIYPFWFFFAQTWIGNIMMIPICLMPLPIMVNIIFPSIMGISGEEAESMGIGLAVLTLLCSPFIFAVFVIISHWLETNYEKWNYKIEMEIKMI